MFKLGAQEMIDVKFLEFQIDFFEVVWTMVSSQRKCPIEPSSSMFVTSVAAGLNSGQFNQ